jgi:hypothetical protein
MLCRALVVGSLIAITQTYNPAKQVELCGDMMDNTETLMVRDAIMIGSTGQFKFESIGRHRCHVDSRLLISDISRARGVDHLRSTTLYWIQYPQPKKIVVLTAPRAILMRYLSFRAHRPEAFGHAVPSESSPSD